LEQAVVVSVGDTRVGLVVDQVVGNHQTVIKSLGKVYKTADCVSGATILGDGMVAMILDLAAIVRNAQHDEVEIIARNAQIERPAAA
jgi:two-component system chemotaxis sensor kinase CheA